MYHCHTRFYLMGRQRQLFEKVKKLPLLEGFTYEFLESDRPEEELATRADVIFADLRGTNAAATAELLARWRGAGAPFQPLCFSSYLLSASLCGCLFLFCFFCCL